MTNFKPMPRFTIREHTPESRQKSEAQFAELQAEIGLRFEDLFGHAPLKPDFVVIFEPRPHWWQRLIDVLRSKLRKGA